MTESKALTIGQELGARRDQFAAALPAHIPAERFSRVVLTAIQNNPDLMRADRPSLWNACMRAAQDGLLPDQRDGALVIYSTKVGTEWIKKVQWMPMVAGIRKKVRNSGEIATWDVDIVHEKDEFEYELGDDPFIKHRPYWKGDPGPMIAVYSVAVLKTGEKSREVMSKAEVDRVRDTFAKKDSKGEFSAAWRNSYEEMAKKTIARRHAKMLPMSTDLDDLVRRDDELYDLKGASDKEKPQRPLRERLEAAANFDPDTGEIKEHHATHPEMDTALAKDAEYLRAMGQDPGPTLKDIEPAEGPTPSPEAEGADMLKMSDAEGASASAPTVDPVATAPIPFTADELAALEAKGDGIAKNGPKALKDWLLIYMTPEENDAATDAMRKRWRIIASWAKK